MPTDAHVASSGEPSAKIIVQLPEDLPLSLVSEYLDDCRKDLSALNAALLASDHERVRVFGHQMKGTGGPYGFPGLTTLGSAIERAARHKDAPELDTLLKQLKDYLSRVEIAAD